MPTSTFHAPSGRLFEMERDLIDVTCLSRPDESWVHRDPAGHQHRWLFDGVPGVYRPQAKATVPTVKWVRTGTGYYEDGEEYEIGHHECRECGAKVEPGHTADTSKQFIHGLASYYIDGERVSEEHYKAEGQKEIAAIESLESGVDGSRRIEGRCQRSRS